MSTIEVSANINAAAITSPDLIPASVARSRNGRRRGRGRGRGNHKKEQDWNATENEQKKIEGKSEIESDRDQTKKASRKKRSKKQVKWWKNLKIIPAGEVDPISLEPIEELTYPPFVLAASEPYDVIHVPGDVKKLSLDEINTKWHLFDGRVLAYYLVSQMQFIDPLNRRELTRRELLHLDKYLKQFNLIPNSPSTGLAKKGPSSKHKSNGVVIAAFDSIERRQNTSGQQNGQTGQTRVEVLQREAAEILSALFGNAPGTSGLGRQRQSRSGRGELISGTSGAVNAATNVSTSSHLTNFMSEFERIHREDEIRMRNGMAAAATSSLQPSDSESRDYGMVLIDDDLNPELRGQIGNAITRIQNIGPIPRVAHAHSNSTSSILFPSLQETIQSQPSIFPPLPVSSSAAGTQERNTLGQKPSQKPAASSSLNHISKLVKPTKASDLIKAKKAREVAMQRAAMSQLTFEDLQQKQQQLDSVSSEEKLSVETEITLPPSQSLIKRNMRLADALGVTPSSQRNTFRSSLATDASSNFNAELIAANYPDSLIKTAKENMDLIRKLEKRWVSFLKDDNTRSFQCNPMPRHLRRLVHEYSDYWFLHTESFDPQPKRYVNCVKTMNTKVPNPLLSVVVSSWRGPRSISNPLDDNNNGKSFLGTATDHFSDNTIEDDLNIERPKLKLASRTLPTDLPPFKTEKQKREEALVERLKAQEEENERRKQEKTSMSHDTIFDAFADENSSQDNDDDSSVWTTESAPHHSDEE